MLELGDQKRRPDGIKTGGLPRKAVEEELRRILMSRRFADSPRLSSFLRFVVEAKLEDREDRVQEYTIGVEVFDRGESFDPRVDSIVRVEARRLRDRLAEYYSNSGSGGPVLIQLPRRGYLPELVETRYAGTSRSKRLLPDLGLLLKNPKVAWGTAAALAACIFLLLYPRPESGEDIIELSLEPPPGGILLTPSRGGGPAVSPDGGRYVFSVRDSGGATSLYLRSLERAQPQRLAGTENAKWPFWSPDGGRIGFAALDKLKILDLDREVVRTIADIPDYRGGAWSELGGGVVVVATRRGPLRRIPAAGGTLQKAWALAEGERSSRQPIFLPGGKRLLYTSLRSQGPSEIRVADLDTGKSKVLIEGASGAQYARTMDGRRWLLFKRGDSLLACQVDANTLSSLSPSANLAGGLPLDGTGDFSVDGIGAFSVARNALAYFHGSGPVGRSRLAWRSRTGRTLGTLGEPDNYIYVRLSPDERSLAVTTSSGQADVWTMDAATGIATRQTDHPKLDRTPVWSPDGRQILISTNRNNDGGRIYALAADGSAKAAPWLDYRADGEFSDWPSQWHEPSSTVLFYRRAEGGYDIWERTPGQPPRPLIRAPGLQTNAQLSPDQRHVAYVSNELGEREVFLCTYPSTGSRIRVSPSGGNYPLWRADGTELYFVSPDGHIMAVGISAERLLRPTLPRPLFRVQFPVPPGATVYQYDVTKDGERFMVIEEVEGPSTTVVLNWQRLVAR